MYTWKTSETELQQPVSFIAQVSGCLLQTAQTWANAGVCSASCAHAFGCMFVCLFVCYNLFVCFTGNLGDWVLGRGGSLLLLEKLWDFLLQ